MRILAAAIIALAMPAMADWWVVTVDPAAYDFSEPGEPAPGGLPDGKVAPGAADIAAAWYVYPTRRYGHGILGDAVEAGGLRVETAAGDTLTHELPEDMVFEDRTPRVIDLDGDGRAEVVAIRASLREGGSVAVYGLREARLTEIAAIDFIGTRNRWLNIASLEDMDGDGRRDIAFVRTPHIGGTLRLFRYEEGAPVLLDEAHGFSNHAIGAYEQRLSATADLDGDGDMELALPDDARRTLKIMDWRGGLVEIASIRLPAGIATAILADRTGPDARFVMGLSDGSVVAVSR